MQQTAHGCDQPLPLATAALANLALTLLMWDVVLGLVFFLARCCGAGGF